MGVVEAAEDFDLSFNLFEDFLHLDLALIQNLDGHFVISDLIDRHYRQLRVNNQNWKKRRKINGPINLA